MKLVPIVDILKDLDAVVGFEDSVGSDDLVLTPKDQAELAILSNMCGLWSWKFKPHLDKSLDSLQVVDGSVSVDGVLVSLVQFQLMVYWLARAGQIPFVR
jgi:hypothetical protein